MASVIDGLDIVVRIREVGETEWKEMTCDIDKQIDLTNDTTETDTRCGTFFGTKVAKGNYSGNAAFNVDTEEDEVSYNDVYNWQQNRTKLEFLVENAAYQTDAGDDIAQGAVLHHFMTGKFINSSFQGAVGDIGKFSWQFKPQGQVNTSGTSA